jgi:hypothetical protein
LCCWSEHNPVYEKSAARVLAVDGLVILNALVPLGKEVGCRCYMQDSPPAGVAFQIAAGPENLFGREMEPADAVYVGTLKNSGTWPNLLRRLTWSVRRR